MTKKVTIVKREQFEGIMLRPRPKRQGTAILIGDHDLIPEIDDLLEGLENTHIVVRIDIGIIEEG